ncbi:hypothetical protein HMPREF2955_10090 [Prevotella sp. HMSC073D09]|uniref:ABC transporter permease n=1 Tax=Prevotella sp. HMSC073D09 TaxID=1739459 RepID=UPI0008A1CF24|nr:ABC transporter permease [Prevotella sp. HMSC073D09]OFQ18304.1 hypothetical protein HMPREF2955_10090 [Prevotella sp. HMSC073D09]
MNDNFNASRFWAYLTKLLVERWRTNLLRLGILFGCLLIIELWMASVSYDRDETSYDRAAGILLPIFSIILLVSGCFFASEMLSGARRKAERIGALTFPVTPFENWLARWTISIPLYLVCFLVCMYVADAFRVAFFSAIYPKTPIEFISIWRREDYDGEVFLNAWLMYFWCTAVYALGSILFVKRSILKTTLTLFILFWITAFVVLGLVMVSSGNYNNIFESVLVAYGWVSVLFLWWLSYSCFKEMEVVDDFSFNGSKAWVVGYCMVSVLFISICSMFDKSALDAVGQHSVDETAIFLERTVEKRIAPISVVQFEDSSCTDLADEYNLTLAVEVNYVSDASKCSVIYPEQVIQVRQQGDTLYYTYNPELYKRDMADMNFVNGPDGMADASSACYEGKINYQIKGADGKVRTAVDQHYRDGNKVRIVINTLPGNLAVRQTSRQSTLIGAGKTKAVSVEGGFSLELDSLSHIDALSVMGPRVFRIGTAHVNSLVVTLVEREDGVGEMQTEFNTDYPAVINHVLIKGVGKMSGLSKMSCKRIELLPDTVGSITLEVKDVKRKMVLE